MIADRNPHHLTLSKNALHTVTVTVIRWCIVWRYDTHYGSIIVCIRNGKMMTYMRSVSYLRNVCNSTTVLHDTSSVSHGEKSALVPFSAMLVFGSLEVGPFTTLITLYSAIINPIGNLKYSSWVTFASKNNLNSALLLDSILPWLLLCSALISSTLPCLSASCLVAKWSLLFI